MYNNGMIYPLHLGVTNFKQGCFGLGTRCGWQGGPRLEYWLMVGFGIYTVNRTCFMGYWWILSCKQVLNQPADMTSQWICFMRSREIILWALSENRWEYDIPKFDGEAFSQNFPKCSLVAYPIFRYTHDWASEFRLGCFKRSKNIIILVNTAMITTMISVMRYYEYIIISFVDISLLAITSYHY